MTAAQPTISGSGGVSLAERSRVAAPAILFGLRVWASVCLALWVAFTLQLSEPSWAGTTAALVGQPLLGASLRKASFRMVGTVVGAVAIVVISAYFRQDRVSFLVALAVWCGGCAFVATLLTNFAAYAAALAGYTAAILAIDILGPIGATDAGSVTMFAINRAIEICVGIVSAGVVLALTDLGHSRRRLASEFTSLAAAVMGGFADCFVTNSPEQSRLQPLRRELLRRVIALDPMIDSAIGEASDLRYRSPILQQAVIGLMETISVWRKVAFAIENNPDGAMSGEADLVHKQLPHDRLSASAGGSSIGPADLRRECCAAARSLVRLPAQTPRQQLLADSAATGMIGMSRALNGLTVVVNPREAIRVRGAARLRVPDTLPAAINAARAFATVAVLSLFWVASAWSSGVTAITFAAVIVILLPLQGDQAYNASMTFLVGCVISLILAAIAVFGILPNAQTFPSLCLVLGLVLVPFASLMALPWRPLMCMAASVNFLPMLSLTNQMTYNASNFWNGNLAIVGGIGVAAIAFKIVPPVPPPIRARRLLALTLADLRRLARRAAPGRLEAWEGRGFARLLAMPEEAQPVQRAELVSMVAVGKEILRLRHAAPRFIPNRALGAALEALAEGRSRQAIAGFEQVDRELAALPSARAMSRIVLTLRASLLVICGQLSEFPACYDGEPTG
jgi:uncharacterized membrane protein YccC